MFLKTHFVGGGAVKIYSRLKKYIKVHCRVIILQEPGRPYTANGVQFVFILLYCFKILQY